MKTVQFDRTQNADFLNDSLPVAIIVANFYPEIGQKLLKGAVETLEKYGLDEEKIVVFYVSGAFEVPLMAEVLTETRKYTGIITLGAVIQGETPHFDFVCNECARGVMRVNLQHNIPVTFGVLTTQTMAQTLARAGGSKGNKGVEAALAMIEMRYLLDSV